MNNRHPVEDDKALGRLMADIRKAPLRVRDCKSNFRAALQAVESGHFLSVA